MDESVTSTPTGPLSPLQTSTPDGVNQRREAHMTPFKADGYDSPVLEKISQFNNMSGQSRQLERRTNDALKRAVLGREEAEMEMKRMREEIEQLHAAVEQGKERERKVGERLETVMDSYGRAKETHAHTQALWEKEIRRARKENFKSQSTIVKLQEELKTARTAAKINEECLEREKERSHTREQEAFTARYQIVGVQEQLDKALERVKVVEQERDAYKTAAKNEEVARIAAEGRLPLPLADEIDELASPKKKVQKKRKRDSAKDGGRVSLSAMDLVGSAATEIEIEELSLQVAWEKHRAERAQEMVEFLQAECQMHSCRGARETREICHATPQNTIEPVESTTPAERITIAVPDTSEDTTITIDYLTKERSSAKSVEPAELAQPVVYEPEPMADVEMTPERQEIQQQSTTPATEERHEVMDEDEPKEELEDDTEMLPEHILSAEYHGPTIEAPAMEELQQLPEPAPEPVEEFESMVEERKLDAENAADEAMAPSADAVPELEPEPFVGHQNESHHESDGEERRESLPDPESLDEHHLIIIKPRKERTSTIFCPKEGVFRTVSEQEAEAAALEERFQPKPVEEEMEDSLDIILPDAMEEARSPRLYARTPSVEPPACAIMSRDCFTRDRTSLQSLLSAPHSEVESSIPKTFNIPTVEDYESRTEIAVDDVAEEAVVDEDEYEARLAPGSPTPTMYSSTSRFKVTTTTVPVRDESSQHSSSFNEKLRTPSASSSASFDLTDPALTPTMTREQALAKIRERRGRARSIAQATALVLGQGPSQQDNSENHLKNHCDDCDTGQACTQASNQANQQANKQGGKQGP
ncbi:hypothetical protein ISF_04908 [Cordyceps fumosorosea ARSEF 2679]|uniref:Uncharacterized protein n=1 Tax=Cordyceps fumosorosea (strain ARSEF 2679) TaxID=1081104 RepID=A0A162J2Y4_CORFA|nr:hypothetical protein ISF_04908 [Cordyceps fumosorosea ARSEF 2679]OAA63032.1 hypothetical protein ISF_04908 [Cordyceps fumosorosea ARSEF 2679]